MTNTESKHTPEHWLLHGLGRGRLTVSDSMNRLICVLDKSHPNSIQNSQLIASAPRLLQERDELLAALGEVKRYLERDDYLAAYRETKAAITKAEAK